ncbi:MAG: 1-acyl-sn-glycerol-3-phosphate acyltransferase [Alcanivoracaceae bacterium]|nr:1-acyl-sn-glycerol-3-phosphate acyltransferase [Alcanivoracaceae bacterium]
MRLGRSTADWAKDIKIDQPGVIAPWVARVATSVLYPLARLLFRARLRGIEHLPNDKPFLLVANHSAGAGIAEIMSFIALYLRHAGSQHRLAGFALPQGFSVFPLSRLLKSIGAIPSSYEAAQQTLTQGVPILVFPGGDHETLRPVWQANRVDFGGRTGFLKIARDAGVPIVPLGIHGSHYTCPVFLRAQWLAWVLVVPRLIGLKRWGVSLTGLLGAAAIFACVPLAIEWRALIVWLWLGSPLVFLPIVPWRITMTIGAAIEPEKLFADKDCLPGALTQVEHVVERLVLDGKSIQ